MYMDSYLIVKICCSIIVTCIINTLMYYQYEVNWRNFCPTLFLLNWVLIECHGSEHWDSIWSILQLKQDQKQVWKLVSPFSKLLIHDDDDWIPRFIICWFLLFKWLYMYCFVISINSNTVQYIYLDIPNTYWCKFHVG